jgi:hypothetical protein
LSPPARLAKPFWRADETVFWDSEGVLKPTSPIKETDQQRGSIMSAFITNLVLPAVLREISGRSGSASTLLDLSRKPAAQG